LLAPNPRRPLFFVAIVTMCFTVGPILRYVSQHRYFAVRHVEVSGTQRIDPARVRMWLGKVEGGSIWNTSPESLSAAVEQDPAIARASVRRVLPDGLRVKIRERRPRAVLRRGEAFFFVDDTGHVFDDARGSLGELPIISVDAEPSVVPAGVRELREAVRAARLFESGLAGVTISEIAIRPGPELVGYTRDGQLRVRLGWGGVRSKLLALRRVLRHVRNESTVAVVGTIDVRDPLAVVMRLSPGRPLARDRAA
jgi:cell division protein FtsQ